MFRWLRERVRVVFGFAADVDANSLVDLSALNVCVGVCVFVFLPGFEFFPFAPRCVCRLRGFYFFRKFLARRIRDGGNEKKLPLERVPTYLSRQWQMVDVPADSNDESYTWQIRVYLSRRKSNSEPVDDAQRMTDMIFLFVRARRMP